MQRIKVDLPDPDDPVRGPPCILVAPLRVGMVVVEGARRRGDGSRGDRHLASSDAGLRVDGARGGADRLAQMAGGAAPS